MKKILLLFLLSPMLSMAQDSTEATCNLIRQTDPYTKGKTLSTGFINLDGGSVIIDANSTEIDIMFSISGVDKCYDNNSVAWIFFEGVKTKFTSRNGGTMNCEGLFHFIYKNTSSANTVLQKLMTMKTNRIVFTGNNKKETIINIKPGDQEKFMALLTCLVNEAKTLIK